MKTGDGGVDMRRFVLGALCGGAYIGLFSLLTMVGISPGVLLPALVYAGLGWWAASGSENLKAALHRAGTAALGCAVAAWLISAAAAAPRFVEMTFGQAASVLLVAFLSEVKFVALAALVGRRRVTAKARASA
jgi:hypothetical protein